MSRQPPARRLVTPAGIALLAALLPAAPGVAPALGQGTLSCETCPDTLDFGTIRQGETASRSVTVTNAGTEPLTIGSGYVGSPFRATGWGRTLLPGQSCEMGFSFTPTMLGDFATRANFNDACPKVVLEGSCRRGPICCVFAAEIDFGEVMVGLAAERTFTFTNCGDGLLEGVVPEACGPYAVVEGAGPFSLAKEVRLLVRVRFAPSDIEPYDCILAIGEDCAVPLHGTGGEPGPICSFDPERLEFGEVAVGAYRDLSVVLENAGVLPLQAQFPVACGPEFRVISGAGPIALVPGQSIAATVRFAPQTGGTKGCLLALDGVPCGIACTGNSGPAGAADRIGIFWDEAATITCRDAPPGPVMGYLAILNPSASGVAGWECRLDWQPEGSFVPLFFEPLGDGPLSVGLPPEFQVVLRTPLPSLPVLPIMRMHLFATAPGATLFAIGPLPWGPQHPEPCYADAGDVGSLLPLTPTSGAYDLPVAQLNGCSSYVGVLGGIPTAGLAIDGGGVVVAWRLDPDGLEAGDVCRLLRRVDGGPERLVAELPPLGGTVEFLDPATDVAPGAWLIYVVALVRSGAELGRSPAVVLQHRPPLPERPLLHACRPNPFNPRTTIAFELPRAGWARLEVFDLAGRRCCTLMDEYLAPGRHERIWEGLDAAGMRVPSGTYYVRLAATGGTVMTKATLLK